MKTKIRILVICFSLVAFSIPKKISSQVLRDTSSTNLIKKGIDLTYNMQFKEANEICLKLKSRFPGHPVVLLLKGMITYWENYPLISTSPQRASYEKDLWNCIDQCDKYNPEDEAEFLLATLCGRGLLLLFYADNGLSSDVNSLAAKTYKYIRRAFNYTDSYSDFYFFTGLYNYYREAYPEAHPIYKAVAFLFPKGDIKKGLNELQTASKKSIVLKAEAYTFLSSIYMSFENNFPESARFSKSLLDLYPQNIAYQAGYIRDLLLIHKYDEAENLIVIYEAKSTNPYFKSQIIIFRGILEEKKYKNVEKAERDYITGLSAMGKYGEYGNEFAAYAYYGLSRISGVRSNKHDQRSYRNKANDIASYKNINFDN